MSNQIIDTSNRDGNVTIPKATYIALLSDAETLARLYAAGVDNWEGFDEAMEADTSNWYQEGGYSDGVFPKDFEGYGR